MSLTAQPAATVPGRKALLGVQAFVDFLFLSPIMETSEFLNTDGVWFGNGAEEEQRSSPLPRPSDHRRVGTSQRVPGWLTPALTKKKKRRGDSCGLREAANWSIWDN